MEKTTCVVENVEPHISFVTGDYTVSKGKIRIEQNGWKLSRTPDNISSVSQEFYNVFNFNRDE